MFLLQIITFVISIPKPKLKNQNTKSSQIYNINFGLHSFGRLQKYIFPFNPYQNW